MNISNSTTKRLQSIFRYFGASFIPLILNLIINPFVAKKMSPEDYAIVGYYKSISTLISPLILFYVLHYYTKSYFEISDAERIKLKSTIFKFLIWGGILISFLCVLGIIIYTLFFNTKSKIPLFPYVYISVFSLTLSGIYQLTLVDLRMSRNSKKFFWYSLGYSMCSVFFTILLVIIIKLGALGNMTAILACNLIIFIYCLYGYKDLFRIQVDRIIIKKMLIFCTPLTIAAMLDFFSNGYDKVYLERLGNITELGYYVVGATMAGYITTFSSAIGSTFQPDIFQSIAQRNKKTYLKYASIVIGSTTIIAAFAILLAPYIINILTSGRYVYSSIYMRIISISAITSSIYYMLSQFTIAIGLPKITLINKVIGSIISIFLFYILINKFGFLGAAIGVILSFVVFSIGNIFILLIYKNKFILLWRRKTN